MIKNENMKNLIVIPRKELVVFPALEGHVYGKGKYLVVTKCRAGFPVTSVIEADSPIAAFRRYKPKAIMNISKIHETLNHNSTVFARVGKKVWIAEEMLVAMKVGDINQDLYNTGLYHSGQYLAVNAKSWDSFAYVNNVEESVIAA